MKSTKEICKTISTDDDEYIFLTNVVDKIELCGNRNIMTNTIFLDERKLALCSQLLTAIKCSNYIFFGGYNDAIRKACFFIPDYDVTPDKITYLRVTKSKNDTLLHKDYLGSLMGLNLQRGMFGDIIVTNTGADIIIMKDILELLLLEYNKVGRKTVISTEITEDMLCVAIDDFKIIEDIISSMRFDLVVSSAFSLSRSSSKELIEKGKVLLNSFSACKPDKLVEIGDKINIKGMGKAIVFDTPYITRKNKIKIQIKKY